jgi:LysR family hydrogen peroxide-inducible transcriptional activator
VSKLNFTITQIEYVLAIEKYGHFSKAAEVCSITQPTLSMQIQKLEDSLGFILFDRSKKPIRVTDRARPVIEQMKTIYFEIQKMNELIRGDAHGPLSGELIVGIIPTLSPYILPLLLPLLKKSLPRLKVEFRELQTSEIIQSLKRDEIDLGILALSLNEPKITERPLFWEPFSIVCSQKHPLSQTKKVRQQDISTDGLWLLEEGHCLRNQVLDLCSIKNRRNFQGQFRFESGSIETLKNLVNTVGGYTLIPQLAINSVGDHCVLLPFDKPVPARQIGLVMMREHLKTELINAFENQVMQSIPSSLKQLKKKDLDVLPID